MEDAPRRAVSISQSDTLPLPLYRALWVDVEELSFCSLVNFVMFWQLNIFITKQIFMIYFFVFAKFIFLLLVLILTKPVFYIVFLVWNETHKKKKQFTQVRYPNL